MWIRKVVARAFGPFQGEAVELARGMNVICGPNEAGKSTWHGAIYAALCGMRRGRGAMRSDDREFKNRYFPWHHDSWEVSAEVVLSDGRALEIYNDLDGRVDSRITDLGTGRDISSDYMVEGAPDGSALLGLTRDIVLSTIFVRQAEIMAVTQNAGNLQEQLQRAAATSGNDATAEEALTLIDDFRRQNVGKEVRHSTKPLQSAIADLERCRNELAAARAQHDEYVRLLREAQEAETASDRATRELRIARALQAREELEERARRLADAEEMTAGLPAERPPEKHGLAAEVEELRGALIAFKGRLPYKPLPEGRSATAIAAELDGLPERPDGDTEVHESVFHAFDRLKDRKSALETAGADPVVEPAAKEIAGTPSELRRLADDIDTPVPDVDQDLIDQLEKGRTAEASPWTRPTIIAGTAAVLIGIGLFVAQLQLIGVGVALVGVVLLVSFWLRHEKPAVSKVELQTRVTYQQEVRRGAEARRQKAAARIRELGLPNEPEEIRRIARSAESAESDRERFAQWQSRLERLRADLEHAESALRTALEARGLTEAADRALSVEALVERYIRACRNRSEQAAKAARREDLKAELKATQEVEKAWKEQQRQRDHAEQRLIAALADVGCGAVEPRDLPGEAEARLNEHEAQEVRNRDARERWAKLEGVLRGETLESLRAEVDALESSLPTLPKDWTGENDSSLLNDRPRLEAEAREAARRASELGGRAQDRAENIADVALAEEAYQRAQEELERVRQLDRVLDQTHRFLSEARDQVQRAIAPRLKSAVERHLSKITDGRYTEVIVNGETLSVSVKDSVGHWRDADLLSHGTTEQVYLLLRVGLVEFIATTGEAAPLILDDVTVQCDSDRTVAVLDMLLELSEERQIVLFSQEREVLAWAREHLEGDANQLIELSPQTVTAGS